MEEIIKLKVECEDCNFSADLQHQLDPEKYIMEICPCCGSEDFHGEEQED